MPDSKERVFSVLLGLERSLTLDQGVASLANEQNGRRGEVGVVNLEIDR